MALINNIIYSCLYLILLNSEVFEEAQELRKPSLCLIIQLGVTPIKIAILKLPCLI